LNEVYAKKSLVETKLFYYNIIFSMPTHQNSHDNSINHTNIWIAGDRTRTGGTADEFINSETDSAPDYSANYYPTYSAHTYLTHFSNLLSSAGFGKAPTNCSTLRPSLKIIIVGID
jgi:hypothetical protein